MKRHLADYYKLTKEQRAYRFKKNNLLAFGKYVDWLTEDWTAKHWDLGVKKLYSLTPEGLAEAERLKLELDGLDHP